MKQNPKAFYAYVQSTKTNRQEVGMLEDGDGLQVTENVGRAELFREFFKSTFRSLKLQPDSHDRPRPGKEIMTINISEAEVLKELKQLNPTKSAGPDGLHPAVIKPLADIIANPVFELFKQSLDTGEIPDDWRMATVVAIHKNGPRSKASNYRPVSLTSILSKTLERVIRLHLSSFLTVEKLLSPIQHGFRPRKSCLTNLICFLEEITSKLDEGTPVKVCYLDFSKAFDSVNHSMLLHKVEAYGITGMLKKWINSFLSNRTFSVRVGEASSERAEITSGVPQGSVLGPLLFLLYVNDLANTLSNPVFMFADDVKITGQDLKSDIEKVIAWSEKWDLPLNQKKCRILTTNSEESGLLFEPCAEIKDLGVIMTNDFKQAKQCQHAANKARCQLFRIKSTLANRDKEIFLPIYKTIVRPHLEYCVQAWSPHLTKDIDILEKVQWLATRMIAGQKGKSYKERLTDLNLFSLGRRRLRGDLIETFKIINEKTDISFEDLFRYKPVNNTRGNSQRLERNHTKLDIRNNVFHTTSDTLLECTPRKCRAKYNNRNLQTSP